MWYPTLTKAKNSPLLLAVIVASGLLFAGCDEHVDVVRDHSVAIPKHATWAWRPAAPEKNPEKNPVISRDVISDDGRQETVSRESRMDNETFRLAIRTDIEKTLADKGFKQVDDPAAADLPRIPHADALHYGTRPHVVTGRARHHGLHSENVECERQSSPADLSRVAPPPELVP